MMNAAFGQGMLRIRIVAALALLMFAGLALLWADREPIARYYIDDALRARHVRATYRLVRLGLRSQTIENIRLGDPAHPDLVAARVTVRLAVGLDGPQLVAIAADSVRARGRLADGRLSFGDVDRLLPEASGGQPGLPDLLVTLNDVRLRLATPFGAVAMTAAGSGNLAGGFAGRLTARMTRAIASGCTLDRPSFDWRVTVAGGEPTLAGPLRADRIYCRVADAEAPNGKIKLSLSRRLDRMRGQVSIEARKADVDGATTRALRGRATFAGSLERLGGAVSLLASDAATAQGTAQDIAFSGRYGLDRHVQRLAGRLSTEGVKLSINGPGGSAGAASNPAVPLLAAVRAAVARAAAGFAAHAAISLERLDGLFAGSIVQADAASTSGTRLMLRSTQPGAGAFSLADGRMIANSLLTLTGGGLPDVRLRLNGPIAGGGFTGLATVASYSAGSARLAVAPIHIAGDADGWMLTSRISIDGPLGDGGVAGLSLPIDARLARDGSLRVDPGCAPLTFTSLSIAGTDFAPARITGCPVGEAMVVREADGTMRGGARVVDLQLRGQIGKSPLTITARSASLTLGRPGFAAGTIAVRLGAAGAMTRLDLDRLDGVPNSRGIAGRLAGAAGQIADVPLVLSNGAGSWNLADGVLALGGSVEVADAASPARFERLIAPDVRLHLADGLIRATGTLRASKSREKVAAVSLSHDLRNGTGAAVLDVAGLTFGEALQPEQLTPLTLGIIANVKGALSGQGRVRWSPSGVSSDGDFTTGGVDLAAAFGPVTGLRGHIHFSDLLALATPPGQSVTLGSVNPGVAVTDGVVRYQLLPGQLVRIEGGRWPFSGGALVLEPAQIDLGRPVARRLTFRITGMDAAAFVQQFDFKNLAVTGTFDGVLPMVFDTTGGRIEHGRLAVRKGGGTLAYVGEVSNAQLGAFGKLAFDALKSMRYASLAIDLDGALDGEIVSRVSFDGTNDMPKEARHGLLSQFSNLPFRFNITITAPFRGLLNSAESINDPRGLVHGALIAHPPVQSDESEHKP